MRFLIRWLYAPLFFFGFISLATWLIGYRQASHGWLVPLFLIAVGVSFLAERALPYRREWNRPNQDRWRDVLHAVVNEALNAAGLLALPLMAAWLPKAHLWPLGWPLYTQLFLAIALADLGITLMHYLSHRNALLWRLHAVHHSVRRMYGFNGLMKHPLHQMLEAAAGVLPLLLLGLPVEMAVLLAFAIAIQLLLQHSNVDMRIGVLRHLFAWAPLHRFHHLKYGTLGNVNFALFFTLWDRLLGTAFYRANYRLADNDLGIGDQPAYPQAYIAQLMAPFRRPLKSNIKVVVPVALRDSAQ